MLPEPTGVVVLPDERALAYDDVGDPEGDVVVWLHGAPDCRLARHPDDAIAARAGLRFVAVDRPGYGWSDPPAPSPATFGDDLGRLLDHLGVARCAVAAWSAGAPWGFGVACALGERVHRVVTYGAVAPLEAMVGDPAAAAASGPRTDLALAVAAGDATSDDLADELSLLLVPTPPVPFEQACDQVLETLGATARAAVESVDGLVEALARSLLGAVDRHADAGLRADVKVQYEPGVEALLASVDCETVLVHGADDRVAGPPVGEWLAARLAAGRVEVWDGAGHQGVLVEWERFLRLLATR